MDVRTLTRVLTAAIGRLEDDLLKSDESEETRRTASTLATLAGVYTKLLEASTFEEQLAEIRQDLHEATARLGQPPNESQDADANGVN